MNAFSLVVFDLGNVLLRVADSWEIACAKAGVALARGDFQRHHNLICAFETGTLDEAAYVERAAECFDGVTPAQFAAVFDAWLMDPFPGAADLVRSLKSRGLRTACLSNTNARHWRAILANPSPYAAVHLLDHHFASHEIGHAKPAPDAYRHVERATGIPPAQIVFFDDRPENVDAARALGWQAHLIDPRHDGAEQARRVLDEAL